MKRCFFLLVVSLCLSVCLSAFSLDNLSQQAREAVDERAGQYNLPPDILEKAKGLTSALGITRASLSRQANNALEALGAGEYLSALGSLDQIAAARLSSGQVSAFKDLKVLVDAYILESDLKETPGARGPLAHAVNAITSGDYASATQHLQQIITAVQPTGEQLQVLTKLRDQYEAWAED